MLEIKVSLGLSSTLFRIGLGTTMTSEDILNGILRVVINVAIVHPAEYITIEFQVQMAES